MTWSPRVLLAVAACVTVVLPVSARADWPERTVKMIVTFPAGSANDAAARIIADALGKKMAQNGRRRGQARRGRDHRSRVLRLEPRRSCPSLYGCRIGQRCTIAHREAALRCGQGSGSARCHDRDRADARGWQRARGNHDPGTHEPAEIQSRQIRVGLGSNDSTICVCSVSETKCLGDELRQLSRRIPATGRSRRRPDTGSGDVVGSIVLSGAERQGSLPCGHQSDPRCSTARSSDRARAWLPGTRDQRAWQEFSAGKAMPDSLRARISADVAAVLREPEVRQKLEAGGHNVLGGTAEELNAGIAAQRAWVADISRLIDIRNAQ